MPQKFYAVIKGRKPGLYTSWAKCEEQVVGYSGAKFQSFTNINDACDYLDGISKTNSSKTLSASKHIDIILENESLHVYIDGSYNPRKKIAGYGLVIVKNGDVYLKDFSPYPYNDVIESHNVGIELIGAKRAVELALANNFKKVIIYYDYSGIEKFAKREWRAKTNQTMEYQEFMTKYMKLLDIHFVKIKSHSGNKYNELADKLAKFATSL